MRTLLLSLAYDGRAYHGWQIQNNADTVQARLQEAMARVFGSAPPIKGCSRTDTGVHARMFCVSFSTEAGIPCQRLIPALNVNLPRDIAVTDCREVPEDFHARYDCAGKRYSYEIWNSPVKNPFLDRLVTCWKYPLDEKRMKENGLALLGTHDCSALCAAGSSIDPRDPDADTVRTVTHFDVRREGDTVKITVAADGFLYNMVRIIAGTLLDMEAGRIPHGTMADIIASRDRSRAGHTAPPDGLYLDEVFYNL